MCVVIWNNYANVKRPTLNATNGAFSFFLSLVVADITLLEESDQFKYLNRFATFTAGGGGGGALGNDVASLSLKIPKTPGFHDTTASDWARTNYALGQTVHTVQIAYDAVSGIEGSEIEMAWFQLRNLEIEIAQYHNLATELPATPRPLDAPGYSIIVFDVTDLARSRQRLVEAGGALIEGTYRIDGAEIAFGRDPDGNLLGLQALPASSIYSAKNFDGQGI